MRTLILFTTFLFFTACHLQSYQQQSKPSRNISKSKEPSLPSLAQRGETVSLKDKKSKKPSSPNSAQQIDANISQKNTPRHAKQSKKILDNQKQKQAKLTSAMQTKCVQLATFNLRFFDKSNSDTRKQKVAALINDKQLDLLGLQEITKKNALAQLLPLLDGGDKAWQYTLGASGGNLHLAILYKKHLFILSDTKELNSSNTNNIIRSHEKHWKYFRLPLQTQIKIKTNGQQLTLIVLHLDAGKDSKSCHRRQEQAKDLNGWLNVQKDNLVMLGDYNDTIGNGNGICSTIDTLHSIESNSSFVFLTDTSNGYFAVSDYTYIPSRYASIIDHILLSSTLLTKVQAIEGYLADTIAHNDFSVSDHNPVYFRLCE